MSDTASLNILNLQVFAEDQAAIDKANDTYEANLASDPHYYLWQSEFQTVPMGVGNDPEAFVEAMLVAVPGVNCVRISFNENSFNDDGSLSPEMEGLLIELAEHGIQIIPVMAVGSAQEAQGTSAEIQAELAAETHDAVVRGWTLMFDWMADHPDVEAAVYGYELLNEPAAFDQAIELAAPEVVDAVAEEMAALYVDLMTELAGMVPVTSDAKILVDAWGYAGKTDFLADIMVGDQTAAAILEDVIGEDLVWSVHFYPGWHGTDDVTDQADLEATLAELLAPFGDADVLMTEINAPGTTTYNPYAPDQVTTATALSLDFLIESGVGIGWFPGLQTGSSGVALIESDGDIRYLNQPSLAAVLDAFSRGDEANHSAGDEFVEVVLVEAKLRNQISDPDYPANDVDPVNFAGFGFGYDGSDTILGSGVANNFLYGGSGTDLIVGADHDDFLFGQDGGDVIVSGDGVDHLIGGEGKDTLIAEGEYTIIYGESGGDLFLQNGSDSLTIADFSTVEGDRWTWRQDAMLTGAISMDLNSDGVLDLELLFSDGTSIVVMCQGDVESKSDFFNAFVLDSGLDPSAYLTDDSGSSALDVPLTTSPLSLNGNSASEFISGEAGNDSIIGRGGNDLLYGQDGNDSLFGGAGFDTIVAGSGNDFISSGASGGFLSGGDGADSILGKAESDTILGEDGQDTIRASSGNDEILGGDGNDLLFGQNGDDGISGGLGPDTIEGGAGNDVLDGDEGDDVFILGTGSDHIYGGEGLDTVQGKGSTAVTIDLMLGICSLSDGSVSTIAGVEAVNGSTSDDSIFGSDSKNTLSGKGGHDLIFGNGGKDVLDGGNGRDTLYGGSGDDVFIFDLAAGAGWSDTIGDFRSSDDTIFLIVPDGVDLPSGQLSESNFSANADGKALDADDRIIFDTSDGQVYYDCDGLGGKAGVLMFTVAPGVHVAAADFVLV